MPNTPPDDKQPLAAGHLLLATPITVGAHGDAPLPRRDYRAQLIAAGTIRAQGNRPSSLRIPAATLMDAAARGLFDNRPAFVDHPTEWFGYPSLRDMAGVTLAGAEWDEGSQAVIGTVRLYDNAAGRLVADLFDAILADAQAGQPMPDVGLSAVVWSGWRRVEEDAVGAHGGAPTWEMQPIRHVESVDFVFEPGAEGRVREALAALASLPSPPGRGEGEGANSGAPTVDAPSVNRQSSIENRKSNERTNPMPPEETQQVPDPILEVSTRAALHTSTTPATNAAPWLIALQAAAADAMIAASSLPVASRARLRRLAAAGAFPAPADVEAAVETERAYLAELAEDTTVQVGSLPPRGAGIVLGRTGTEELATALESLIAGLHPPAGVRPLTGIREAYHLLSGDYEMHGIFQPDRVHLANVTSSTMAGLVANAMNKVVVNMFQQYPHWWDAAVTIMEFTTLQDARWITMGGVGELPTVAEGAAYTELTWDDQTETDAFVKKGGYLGLTLEAIDKDDTGRIQAAPRALAQAAWLTLGKSIAEIFTTASDLGPTMSDTGTLFNATAHSSTGGHVNLLTTALSFTAWEAVKVAMMKQPELNSGERLGALTRPKLLWVPVDLETTALQILASEGEPGTADNDINPFASGTDREARLAAARRRVVVCPLWTDANNWAAQADPNLYPSIGLGFRYGRTPEIFSVASPTAGLMFTNDTLPVKVRFFFAVGPIDWRGLHKNNVT